MKSREDTWIGDPVEVFMVSRTEGDGPAVRVLEIWRPATVCFVTSERIGVALAGGVRIEIERRSAKWRPA